MRHIHYISIILLVYIDQITKSCVVGMQNNVIINQYVNIVFVKNYGITFGFFNKPDEFIFRVMISLITALVTLYLCIIAKRNANIYFLIIAGAVGNLFDRVRIGYVIDFLDVHFNKLHWPAFNLADSYICIGVVLLLFFGKGLGKI